LAQVLRATADGQMAAPRWENGTHSMEGIDMSPLIFVGIGATAPLAIYALVFVGCRVTCAISGHTVSDFANLVDHAPCARCGSLLADVPSVALPREVAAPNPRPASPALAMKALGA